MRVGDQVDRRPGERGGLEQDVDGLRRQAGEAAAEQLVQGLGHRQGATGREPRVRTDELTAQLEREERVPRGRIGETDELRPSQLETESLLEHVVKRGQAERADRQQLEPLFPEGALELDAER